MVVRDIILVVAVLGVMVFGFFVMKRLDKFLDEMVEDGYISLENYKKIVRENALKLLNRGERA